MMPRIVPTMSGRNVSSGSCTEAGMNGRNAAAWGSSGRAPTMSGYSCGGTSEIAMQGPFWRRVLGPYPTTPPPPDRNLTRGQARTEPPRGNPRAVAALVRSGSPPSSAEDAPGPSPPRLRPWPARPGPEREKYWQTRVALAEGVGRAVNSGAATQGRPYRTFRLRPALRDGWASALDHTVADYVPDPARTAGGPAPALDDRAIAAGLAPVTDRAILLDIVAAHPGRTGMAVSARAGAGEPVTADIAGQVHGARRLRGQAAALGHHGVRSPQGLQEGRSARHGSFGWRNLSAGGEGTRTEDEHEDEDHGSHLGASFTGRDGSLQRKVLDFDIT